MSFLKLLASFAPWIAFLLIAHDNLLRVKIGLVVALVLSIAMGLLRLHRGIILWVGLAFFTAATVAVIGFENRWVLQHMGVLANGALAAGAWTTLAIGRPFTLDYARAQVDRSMWDNPLFVRSNRLITAIWAAAFTVNAGLAWLKMRHVGLSDLGYELLTYALLVGVALFTTWYPAWLRRRHADAAPPGRP